MTPNPPPRTAPWRRHLATAAAAAALVAGCSSPTASTAVNPGPGTASPAASTTAAAPAVAHGIEAPITAIPWDHVGPGWMLAMWNPAARTRPGANPAPPTPSPETAATTLYLLSPQGDRYPITTFAPPSGFPRPGVIGWTADGRRALVTTGDGRDSKVIEIDLHTGARTTIPGLAANGSGRLTYADGTGSDFLISTYGQGATPGTLKLVDRAGNTEVTYPTDQLAGAGRFGGDYLISPDGAELVLPTANWGNELVPRKDNSLVVFSKEGSVVATLPSPMPNAYCSAVKWWQPTVILASCHSEHGSGSQLWEVPLVGAPTALTAVNSGQGEDPGFGGDIGDQDAWQLPAGTFLRSEGACGTMFLSRLTPDMTTTRVNVPGVSGSVIVAGATADKLLLEAYMGCGGSNSLLAYDPAANTSTVLLGPPVIGGGVTGVTLFPGRQ
jgi:TolB protein